MRTANLFLLSLAILLVSCASMPRDDAESYEQAVRDYEKGFYNFALPRLEEYADIDSLYYPLIASIAHLHYQAGRPDTAGYWLERAIHLTDELPLEYLAFKAEQDLDANRPEVLGFLDYVNSVGRRYGIDTGLLLAIMLKESSFVSRAVSPTGAVGMMQLMPATGKALGLSVPTENYVKEPPIRQHEQDERFHPAKNIAGGASHLNFLLNHYRYGTRNTNLRKALAAYYAGTGNVRDSIPSYCDYYVNKISEYYLNYRYRFDKHQEVEQTYYRLNPDAPGFSKTGKSKAFPRKKMLKEFERIRQYAKTIADDDTRAIYNNNLGLMAESLGLRDSALVFYRTALGINPAGDPALYNRGCLLFEEADYRGAIDDFQRISGESGHRHHADVLIVSAMISLGYLDEAMDHLSRIEQRNSLDPDREELEGIIAVMQGNPDIAIDRFEQAVERRGSQADISNLLAAWYARYFGDDIEIEYTLLHNSDMLSSSWLAWPLPQRYISSYYGWRPNAIESNWRKRLEKMEYHSGIDIPAPKGTPVQVAADGVVLSSDFNDVSGNSICVQHDNGWFTCYYHLDERKAEKGDRVKQGDVIGLVGTTGRSTGNHLHFGLLDRSMKPVNPLLYLSGY